MLLEILQEHIPNLRKTGSEWTGSCPFHEDKRPSFSMNPEKELWYCFSCHKGGNAIDFLAEILHITKEEAALSLLPNDPRLLANEEFTVASHDYLLKHGCEYIEKKGFSAKSIEKFRLGLAPPEVPNDFWLFRGRALFPICDGQGIVRGFSARTLTAEMPKFINSRGSDIFEKRRILYGYNLAKDVIRSRNEVLLLEGQADVIMAHERGYPMAVGLMSTEFTEEQQKMLGKARVALCLDGDEAGRQATQRILEKTNISSVVILPDGIDPDEYLSSGRKLVGTSAPLYQFASLDRGDLNYADKVFDLLSKQYNSLVTKEVLTKLSIETSVPMRIVWDNYIRYVSEKRRRKNAAGSYPSSRTQ